MKNYIKSILAFLSLVIVAIVLAQVSAEAGAAGGITYAMAIAVYTKACEKNTGGNSRVFYTEAANVSSVTVSAGEVTAITMASGKTFHEVQAEIDTVIRTEVASGRRTNISYLHRVEMKFGKPQTALNTLSDSLTAASACGIIAIVQDGNGNCWLVGYNATDTTNRALYVVQDDTNSGAAPSDEDGNVVTIALETTSGFKDLPFDSTLKAGIIADTATYITYV